MAVDLLPVLAVDLLVQQATACGLPEVFHVSPARSRSIAHVDLRRWRDHASDRSEVFRLQQCKQTTSHGLVLRVYMHVNEAGHAQRLNMFKERPRNSEEVVFREEVDFLSSLAFVVN